MRKITLFIASLFLTLGAMAQSMEFTFTRGEGTAATVTAPEGVTATIETNVAWNTGGAMGTRTDVLCPGRNTSQASGDNFITFTLTIGGLPQGKEFTIAKFTHVAVNSQGNLQPSNDTDIRHCNFTLTANDTEVATLTDQNIWISDGQTERVVALEGASFTADAEGNLVLVLKLAKGTTNNGCFYGLTKIQLTDSSSELQEAIAELQETVGAANDFLKGWTETVGYITAEGKEAVEAALAAANTALETSEGIAEAQATLQNALNGPFETIQPEEGKYYNIVSSCTRDHRAKQQTYVNNNGGMQFAKVNEVATPMARVFQFVSATDGKFYIYNVERGVYMESVGTATTSDVAGAKAVTIANMGKGNIVKIVPDGQSMMHAQDNGSVIVGWNDDAVDNGSAWTIEEVEAATLADLAHEATISDVEWATLVLGYDAEIPEGVTAYAVTGTNATYATLTEVKGAIPAGQAVLLNGAANTYEFKLAESAEVVEGNLLQGSTVNTNVAAEAYVLAAKNGVGLYKAAYNVSTDKSNDGTAEEPAVTYEAFLNNAFKAYLVVEGANAPMFSFDRGEGTTGIDNSQLTIDNSAVIYDLAGRRVEKMEKGIYIVNGKKVIK